MPNDHKGMNILLLTYGLPPSTGGVQVYTQELATAMANLGHRISVVAPAIKGDLENDARMSFKTYRIPAVIPIREAAFFISGLLLCLKVRPKVILATVWLPCGVTALLLSRLLKIPYFVSAHGSEILDQENIANPLKNGIRKNLGWLKRLVLAKAEKVFAVSNYTKQILIKNENIKDNKISVVFNGVDPLVYKLDGDNLRGRQTLLTVGRLEKYKGQKQVIEIMPAIVQKFPNAVYNIAGDGPEHDDLERTINELSLKKNVFLLGKVSADALIKLYQNCNVFVLYPQLTIDNYEGFGLVYLEANACGKPVIASNTGGIRDAVVDGETGFIVPQNDSRQLLEKILLLIGNEALAEKMGQNGRKRVVAEMNWSLAAQKMLDIMQKPVK